MASSLVRLSTTPTPADRFPPFGTVPFYSGSAAFAYKPGAAVASCRRAGTTATLDQLNKYFTINCMPVVSSQYWNMVHGNTPEEVVQDKEGLQIMRTLGSNMAWLLHCIQAGKEQGIALPEREPKEKNKLYPLRKERVCKGRRCLLGTSSAFFLLENFM